MEYMLMIGGLGGAFGSNLNNGLHAIYAKLFEHPLLFSLVFIGVLLLGLQTMRPK